MTQPVKEGYIEAVRKRYTAVGSRKERQAIINEVVANLTIHRKSAIRTLQRKPRNYTTVYRGKQTKYTDDLILPLTTLWEAAGRSCSRRLVTQIGELIDKLKTFKELPLYGNQERLLRTMKTSTIDRLLEGERDISNKEYGISGTKKSPLLKTLIPIRTTFTSDEYQEPGHIEMDCVLHCGTSLTGIYAETLNLLDVATHWNEKSIFLHKTKGKIIGAVHTLKSSFPFLLRSLDFDNGHEFVNWSMHGYCTRENLAFTRSRSYHKNDQAHIEGKNYESVRRVVGYGRIEDAKLVEMWNDIYEHEHRLLTNYFYATMKLKKKKRQGSKIIKQYGEAQTPYQRVLDTKAVSKDVKMQLQKEYETLNPVSLQRSMQKKIQ